MGAYPGVGACLGHYSKMYSLLITYASRYYMGVINYVQTVSASNIYVHVL